MNLWRLQAAWLLHGHAAGAQHSTCWTSSVWTLHTVTACSGSTGKRERRSNGKASLYDSVSNLRPTSSPLSGLNEKSRTCHRQASDDTRLAQWLRLFRKQKETPTHVRAIANCFSRDLCTMWTSYSSGAAAQAAGSAASRKENGRCAKHASQYRHRQM